MANSIWHEHDNIYMTSKHREESEEQDNIKYFNIIHITYAKNILYIIYFTMAA